MDPQAFKEVGSLLTHYSLHLCMAKWRATKDLADAISSGEAEELGFDHSKGCEFKCELPARYKLPCKHWMLRYFYAGDPLSRSLFHPRWFLDNS
jgi:hypothetical protein